jgi:hypothetical protein
MNCNACFKPIQGSPIGYNYNTQNKPTVFLCVGCTKKSLTYCFGKCNTLLKVGEIDVASYQPTSLLDKEVLLCGSCDGKEQIWCDGQCLTLLEVGGRPINDYKCPRNPITTGTTQVKLCDTCRDPSRERIWCNGNCNSLLQVKGNPARVKYMTFKESQLNFCRLCEQDVTATCTVCGAYVANSRDVFPDVGYAGKNLQGQIQYRCAYCYVRKFASQTEQTVSMEIYNWIVKQSNLGIKFAKPNVEVVSTEVLLSKRRDLLESLQSEVGANPANFDVRGYCSSGLQPNGSYKSIVYVERYLPRAKFVAVVAHEMTHAWQSEQQFKNGFKEPEQPGKNASSQERQNWQNYKKVEEGFAQWMAYMYLQAKIDQGVEWKDEAQNAQTDIENFDDEIYGTGFTYFSKVWQKGGSNGVMQLASAILRNPPPA